MAPFGTHEPRWSSRHGDLIEAAVGTSETAVIADLPTGS
jgi:hypothetical protein